MVKTENGWLKIPNQELLRQTVQDIGYSCDECEKLKIPETSGLKRRDSGDENPAPVDVSWYRSCVGKLMYLAKDCEAILYSAKELARGMQAPTVAHYKNLRHTGRYLAGKAGFGTELKIEKESLVGKNNVRIVQVEGMRG